MIYFDPQEAAKTLPMMVASGSPFEIRFTGAKPKDRNFSATAFGYFLEPSAAIEGISKFCETNDYRGGYFSLNRCHEAVMSRRPNWIGFADKNDSTTSDSDIVERRWLPIDIDPIRPSGTPSSDAEFELAKKAGRVLFEKMSKAFNSEPLVLTSGNGTHLLWAINIPRPSDGWESNGGIVKRCLLAAKELAAGCEGIEIDQTTFNPARVWKIPGAWSLKGEELQDQNRVYRKSELLYNPQIYLKSVGTHLLESFAVPVKKEVPRRTESFPERQQINAAEWLGKHGVRIAHQKNWRDGTAYVLEECPFNTSHGRPDSMLIQFPDGKIVFCCLHNSCDQNGWWELRDLLEPGWKDRDNSADFGDRGRIEFYRKQFRSMLREEWSLFREFARKP